MGQSLGDRRRIPLPNGIKGMPRGGAGGGQQRNSQGRDTVLNKTSSIVARILSVLQDGTKGSDLEYSRSEQQCWGNLYGNHSGIYP